MLNAPRQTHFGYVSFRPIPWFAWGPREADLRVDDRIRKAIVFIGRVVDGSFVPYGTGFVAATMFREEEAWQTVVTAKHVIDEIDSPIVNIRLNSCNGDARVIDTPKERWFHHPDERIDVSVCPTRLFRDQFDIAHLPFSIPQWGGNCAITPERIDKHYIGIGDEVYIPGMFIGRIGQKSNLPILRVGTIAAMPEEPIETEYGYHDAFLIEVRSIDGLSGSPVCIDLMHRNLPETAPSRPLPLPEERPELFYLMGIVLGYNEVFNPRDVIEIKERPAAAVTRAMVPLNTGIAVVLPIWRVIEAMEQPKLKEPREALLRESNRDRGQGFVPTSAAPLAAPASGDPAANPDHREDFTRLVSAASKPKPKGDQT
jgi:hypothetical protein